MHLTSSQVLTTRIYAQGLLRNIVVRGIAELTEKHCPSPESRTVVGFAETEELLTRLSGRIL